MTGRSSDGYQLSSELQSLNFTNIGSHPHDHTTRTFFVDYIVRHSFIIDHGSPGSFVSSSVSKHLHRTAISVKLITDHRLSPLLGSCELH